MAKAPLTLLRNAYMDITLEYEGRIVRQHRLTPPYPDLATVRAVLGAIVALYDRLGRRGKGLLVDMRDATGRNDPEFEALLDDFRVRGLHGFTAQAVLMRTAVGRLQAHRHIRTDASDRLVTDDEAAAVSHLLRHLPPLPAGG